MTVFNTGFCTIDEAWGDLTSKQKNKKKKTPQDPICDLYESKVNSSNYSDTDLVRFANEYYDGYDKSKYQRNMKTQSMAYENLEREQSPKNLTIKKNQNNYDITRSPDAETQQPRRNNSSTLFEKQFEMKLPPLYDGECSGNIMPSEEPRIPSFRGAHPEPVIQEEFLRQSRTPKANLYDDYWDDEDSERMFMGISSNAPTYSEVNAEQNIVKPSSMYKPPIQERPVNSNSATFMETFTSGKDLSPPTYSERPPNQPPPRRYSTGEECTNPRNRNSYAEDERPNPRNRNSYAEDERQYFMDDYDDSYGGYQTYKKKTASLQILDLILYVISGIILIFLLEQFVKIGINMQSS